MGVGAAGGDADGVAAGAVVAAVDELERLADRRTVDTGGAAVVVVEPGAGVLEIVVPVAVMTGLPFESALSAAEVASLVLGGGGGMSRAGPLVGSKAGVPEVSVLAVLESALETGVLWPFSGGPETAAATSTPRIDITKSSPAHGNHAGIVRLLPGMIAVGMSRPDRSAAGDERTSGFERRFSR